jgi:Fuc2NAc and GlcNAc transferase
MTRDMWRPLGAFLLSMVGVGLALLYSRRAGLFDIPNHRSSHSVPTPRGGGIAVVTSVLIVAGSELARVGGWSWSVGAAVVGGVLALTFVGWVDDKGSTRMQIRISVHILCGIALGMLVNEIAPVPGGLNISWLAWWVFWTVASINIVNFMDGVDGMIAAQGIVYGIFLFALLPRGALGSSFGLVLAAACLGFLVWNWAPAKMFMGDVGSGPLGLFFVIGGAFALEGAPAALVFLPLFPLFLDALMTLMIRFRRGERLIHPHRSHLYQRLANGGYGHAPVTSIYALTAAIGAVVALSVEDVSTSVMLAAIVLYIFPVMIGWRLLHKRFPDSDISADIKIGGLA